MLRYPVVLEKDDNGTMLVSFLDVPEAHTFGDTKEEALMRAVDALLTALEARIADREPIPTPSEVGERQPRVQVPALAEAKLVLYQTMRQARVNKSQLARRLHTHLPQVDRLIDLRHRSRFDQLEAAFNALDHDIRICVQSRAVASAASPVPDHHRRNIGRPRTVGRVPRSSAR
jgi:antitoxin HicB